jgi:hypothetical protein
VNAAKRRVGPVVALILRQLWELKLEREDLAPIEKERTSHLFVIAAARADRFQLLAREKWKFKDKADRRIAFALAEGTGINRISRELHVGQHRIENVLCEMTKGQKIPWLRKTRGTKNPIGRARLHSRRKARNQRQSKSSRSSSTRQ